MFARIEDNIVREILDVDVLPEFHPSLIWVPCPPTTTQGMIYEDGVFVDPQEIITLEDAKAEANRAISKIRDEKYQQGIPYEGQVFQIDDNAQRDMLSMQTQFLLGNDAAYDGFWMDFDNNQKAMTKTEVQAFFQTCFAYVKALKAAAWAHKANINALTDTAAVQSYDINANWPSFKNI